MNLFEQTLNSLVSPAENRNFGLSAGLSYFGLGTTTAVGQKINDKTSLKISAFWCGVNTIANAVALLPKHIYTKNGQVRAQVIDSPIDFLIHREPNQKMTAYNFWFSLAVCQIVKGNGYARIIRNGGGEVTSLQLLHPDDVSVYEDADKVWYRVTGVKGMLFSDEIYHVSGFSFDGIVGVGVVKVAADNLGVSLAADKFAAESYNNKGISYGVLETDRIVDKKGGENIIKVMGKNLDFNNKHKVAVLDDGMKYKSISLSPAEAQFIEAKVSGVEDIARWLNIPLHKLHTKGEGGYNFLVQMSIEFMQSAVMPLAQRIKEEIERKLLFKADRLKGQFCFINYRKLLEVDPEARTEYYKNMINIKAMNPNEVRVLEDMNPYDGGDEFLQMANMMTQQQIANNLSNAE